MQHRREISLLGFQIARSHVVVHLADEPLCSDRLASAPTSRCPSESTVSAGHWCSRSTRAARALRIAKIYVDVGRQRKATMIRKLLSPVPGQGLIQFLWQLLRLLDERADYRLGVLTCHLGQHHVTRMTLDQGRDVAVVRPRQEIALPMARHCPIFNRRRS